MSAQIGLVWPIALTVLRRLGESVTPKRRGSNRPHKGIDLFAPIGTPVLSAYPGLVLRAVDGTRVDATEGQRRAGWFVDVQGDDGNVYRYLHLGGKPDVRRGDMVLSGSRIGVVGLSGIEHSGPHIHFEIRTSDYDYDRRGYGRPIDPLSRLPELGGSEVPTSQVNEPTEAEVALRYLIGQGWSEEAARKLLERQAPRRGPLYFDEQQPAPLTQKSLEEQLRAIGWSAGDVRKLLAGPSRNGTAEGFVNRLAGSSADVQAAFEQVLKESGLSKTNLPESQSGKGGVGNGATLPSLVKAFAALPQAQQLRLLAMLKGDSELPTKKTGGSGNIAGDVIKSSVDAITQIVKTLSKELGGDKGGGGEKGRGGGGLPELPRDTDIDIIRDKDSEPFPEEPDTDTPPPITSDDGGPDEPRDTSESAPISESEPD